MEPTTPACRRSPNGLFPSLTSTNNVWNNDTVDEIDDRGRLKTTDTNAYSGNNGRAAILSHGLYYAVGNDNNGGGTPTSLTTSTGAELIVPGARVYVLQTGLQLGQPYSVAGYPAALNPSADGLRNLTGRVTEGGRVEIWAVTSTVSANGDQGADPNQLVFVSDRLENTDPAVAAREHFGVLRSSPDDE